MRIEVTEGKAILSKKNLLYNIEETMESMKEVPELLDDSTREELAVLFKFLQILAEVIAVEEKDETDSYPFLGSAWERRKEYHK